MRVAQDLYQNGYITYMRTDSTTLSETALNAARTQIAQLYGAEYLPDAPRTYDRKVKNAQEAHEAIRPAGDSFRTPDAAVRRAARRPAPPLRADLEAHRRLPDGRRPRPVGPVRIGAAAADGRDAEFAASGRSITFPGYLRAYVEGADDPDAALDDRETLLPVLAEGQALPDARARGQGPHHLAARPLHRGLAGEAARGAGHRPPLDLRLDHADHPGPRLRLEEGHRARPDVDGVRGDQAARAALRRPGRLRLHRPHGGRARRDRPAARSSASRGSTGSGSATTAGDGSPTSWPT